VKRLALVLVLQFSVPYLASAQRQGTSGSSSSSSAGGSSGGSTGYSGGGGGGSHSSGSSSGSSGYSGSSSGGYSGGSHSSASGGSSPGGNYGGSHSSASGGSSSGGNYGGSHLSASSGSSSGGSHSSGSTGSPSRPSGNSGGSPSSSHANPYSPVAGSSGDIHGGSRDNSPRSGSSSIIFQSLPTKSLPPSGRPESIQDQSWIHQPFQIEVRPETLDNKSLERVLSERGREVGLESSKSAYKQAMMPLGAPEAHHVSWVGKLFGAKATSTKKAPGSQLRPCTDVECGKIPPPKPCVGAKCPKPGPPKPPPARVGDVCGAGYQARSGTCQPWGYFRDCTYYADSQLGNCRIQWASVDSGYCWRILQEIQHQQKLLQQTSFEQGVACTTAPQGAMCAKLTQDINDETAQIQQLQQQYRMCTTAANQHLRPIVPGTSSLNSWPVFPWP